ncbi:Ig-like domain-containing protein [Leifsonia aquatica]|uniref:Bacterial Ig domain-containing protein n=2 Tax=Leifsonia aquatica TaxID=144185 RepID=A0A7W4V085_LEIAQ|nr:hypothetical protein [Leifsonia aquatica]
MKKTSHKRIGRAALAGATLLGLTATGLAFAAPASADTGTDMVRGPIAGLAFYLPTNSTLPAAYSAAGAAANATWTYPGPGGVGPITSADGRCLQANKTAVGAYQTSVLVTCNDTILDQTWFGTGDATTFKLRARSATSSYQFAWYTDSTVNPPRGVQTNANGAILALGLAAAAPVTIAPSLTSPLPGADITPGTVFTGEAEQNTVITVVDMNGKVIGTAEAGADKTWSLVLIDPPINGDSVLKVVATDTDGLATTLAEGTYSMTGSDEARGFTSPESGTTITPDTVFAGTGGKGEKVVIKDKDGNVLGRATVDDQGHWSTTLSPAPTNGSTDLVIEITGEDGITEQLADNTYTMEGSEEPNAYTGPKTGTITPDTAFTGTGAKGESVVITDGSGNVVGTTTVGQDGQWSLKLDPAPINGNLDLTVTIGDETVANPKVTMTGSDEARSYTGPTSGTITPDTAFTGTGAKGETVVITDGSGNVVGTTTVGLDGQWSLKLDPAPKNGDVNLIVTIGGEKVADSNLVMTGADEERALTSPKSGSQITPDTVFAGTGNIGDVVKIKDKDGNVLGQAEVGQDGTWSTKLSPAPNNGDTNLIIEVTGKGGGDTIQLADNTYEMTESTTKFEVLTPDLSTDNGSITNGTVFTGKGEPGTTVVITDKDGTPVGQAEVDTEGNWSTPVTGLPQGPNNLEITYTAPGADPVSTDLGGIVVVDADEASPMMDPAIAGGAALALLAAAGSFLMIRRRRTSTN